MGRQPPIKRRRKLELAINDLRQLLDDPRRDDRYSALFHATYNLHRFSEDFCRSRDRAALLIDLARRARSSGGPGRDNAERELLKHLDHVLDDCCAQWTDAGSPGFLPWPPPNDDSAPLSPQTAIVADICDFALDNLTFRRPRDSFGGHRRAIAFALLGRASLVFELAEVVPAALKTLRGNRIKECRGALWFLDDYFNARSERPLPDEVVDALTAVADHTPDRASATGALSILVDRGVLSEFHALDLIDDWKAAHERSVTELAEEDE